MRAHLAALAAVITTATGRPVHHLTVTGPATHPYVLVEAGWGAPDPGDLDGTTVAATWDVRVKAVGLTAEQAMSVADTCRAALGGGATVPLTVPGRVAAVTWARHEADYVDTDIRIPPTNTHPCVSVDTYRIHTTKA